MYSLLTTPERITTSSFARGYITPLRDVRQRVRLFVEQPKPQIMSLHSILIDDILQEPEFGPVIITDIETILEDFQYLVTLQQDVMLGPNTYTRNAKAYWYVTEENPGHPVVLKKLRELHIQRIKSAYPLWEDHQPYHNGAYYCYRITKGFTEDVELENEEDFEALSAIKASIDEDLIPDEGDFQIGERE